MKLFLVALAFVVCVSADVAELGYNYHEPAAAPAAPLPSEPERMYIPAAGPAAISHYMAPAQAQPAPAPLNSYVPPSQTEQGPAPINSYVPPRAQSESAPAPAPAPISNYLAPHASPHNVEQPANSYVAVQAAEPAQPLAPTEEIEQTPEDGYHYKTVRRVVYRHRA